MREIEIFREREEGTRMTKTRREKTWNFKE